MKLNRNNLDFDAKKKNVESFSVNKNVGEDV